MSVDKKALLDWIDIQRLANGSPPPKGVELSEVIEFLAKLSLDLYDKLNDALGEEFK